MKKTQFFLNNLYVLHYVSLESPKILLQISCKRTLETYFKRKIVFFSKSLLAERPVSLLLGAALLFGDKAGQLVRSYIPIFLRGGGGVG